MTPLQKELHAARQERLARMYEARPRRSVPRVKWAPPPSAKPPVPSPIEEWWQQLEETRPVKLSIWLIQKTVALHYGVSVEIIYSQSRRGYTIRPRFVAAWLCQTLLGASYSEIGREFNKDHSSIMYACQKVRDDAGNNPVFAEELLGLYDRLEALQGAA